MRSTDQPRRGEVTATFATPREAKRTLEELCNSGIDASRISLTGDTTRRLRARTSEAVGDRRTVGLAARAVAVGLVGGLAVGLLLGVALWALADVGLLTALLPLGGAGLLVGGILGGITRWKENQAWAKVLSVPDLDADVDVSVVVRPADDDQHDLVVERLGDHADEIAG